MTNVAGIIVFVDRFLENSDREYLGASEAAKLMAEAGILPAGGGEADAKLVKVLGQGLIPHAYRKNGDWRIPASGGDVAQCRID